MVLPPADLVSALRVRRPLLGATTVALALGIALAGCTNPDYNEDALQGDACADVDTTAPVAGDECPTGEEGTGSPENDTANTADADLGGD